MCTSQCKGEGCNKAVCIVTKCNQRTRDSSLLYSYCEYEACIFTIQYTMSCYKDLLFIVNLLLIQLNSKFYIKHETRKKIEYMFLECQQKLITQVELNNWSSDDATKPKNP